MVGEKLCRRCNRTKIASEFRTDSRYRDGLGSWCKACHRDRNSSWAKENRDHLTKKAAKWRTENEAAWLQTYRSFHARNKEERAAQHANWAKANRDKRNATSAKRKAAKLRATPPWADLEAITAIYAECIRISEETGISHHVDHIVPLQHKRVCGLHLAVNLRVIPASENVRKKNRLIEEAYKQPDMFVEPPKKAEQENMDL